MAGNDLTTVTTLKAWLFTSSVIPATDDALLSALITRASTMLQSVIGRNLAAADYTESHTGWGAPQCRFKVGNTPINSVASVTIPGIGNIPASPDGIAPGYVIDTNKNGITLVGYYIPRGPNAITVAYNGGYAAIPGDAEQACLDACAWLYARRGRQGLASQSLPQGGQTNYSTKLPQDILDQVSRYSVVVLE